MNRALLLPRAAVGGLLLCVCVAVFLCGGATSASAASREPSRDPTIARSHALRLDFSTMDDLRLALNVLDVNEPNARPAFVLPPEVNAVEADAAASSETDVVSSPDAAAASSAGGTVPQTTTSSRVPSPITTAAPKIAQWTGISVAIVAVAALIAALVLCKLKSKEQCCFAPKPRELVVVVSPGGSRELRSKSPSESSLSSRGSGRSFHEAAVDENAPRRSLLDIAAAAAAAAAANGDNDDDEDTFSDNESVGVEPAQELNDMRSFDMSENGVANTFTPIAAPALPPIGYAAPTPMLPGYGAQSRAEADWSPLMSPGMMGEAPQQPPLTRKPSASSNRGSNGTKPRLGRSGSVSFTM